MVKFDSKTFETICSRCWYILPKGPFNIEEGALATHHITEEMVREKGVTLDSIYDEISDLIRGCDLLSYNGNSFDINFIYKDFKEYGLELDFRRSYDAYAIECSRTSRTLVDVYKKYTGREFDDAHDALSDVKATIEVFRHQVIADPNVEFEEFNIISPENLIILVKGQIVFARGKYSRKPVVDVCRIDPSYIRWCFEICSERTKQTIISEYYKAFPRKKDKA